MSIDPAIIVILAIFVVLVVLFQLIEKLIYHKDIRNLFSAFPTQSDKQLGDEYNAVVRVFTKDGELLFNKVRNNSRRLLKSDDYAFSYQIRLNKDAIVFIPKKVLSFKHLAVPFDKVSSIQHGSRDLGKLQSLETISATIKIPKLTNNVPKVDYYKFLQTFLSQGASDASLSSQIKDMLSQNKMVYVCIQTPEYSFLINYRYKFGVKSV